MPICYLQRQLLIKHDKPYSARSNHFNMHETGVEPLYLNKKALTSIIQHLPSRITPKKVSQLMTR